MTIVFFIIVLLIPKEGIKIRRKDKHSKIHPDFYRGDEFISMRQVSLQTGQNQSIQFKNPT